MFSIMKREEKNWITVGKKSYQEENGSDTSFFLSFSTVANFFNTALCPTTRSRILLHPVVEWSPVVGAGGK